MPGSQTTPSSAATRNIAPADFAFRRVNNVGTRFYNGFAAQWLAYTFDASPTSSRTPAHGSGATWIATLHRSGLSPHTPCRFLPAHSLALRPAHSRCHQFVTRIPKASAISSPPELLRLLPAGAVAGWGLHPLESAAFARRTPTTDIGDVVRCLDQDRLKG